MLEIISDLDIGGAQEVVRTLARFLPDFECSPVVVALRDGPLRGEIERLGIPVEVIAGRTQGFPHLLGTIVELRSIRRDLAAVIARHRIEVVHTHLLRTLDFLVLTLRAEPTVRQVFITFHNARLDVRADQLPTHRWSVIPKRVAHRLLYRVAGRFVTGFIAVSDDVAISVQRDFRPPRRKLFTIANGVDTTRYGQAIDRPAVRDRVGIPADAQLVIVVAKLMEQKGHTYLIRALPSLFGEFQDLHVLLVGDGPMRNDLTARVATLKASARVRLAGNRFDVSDLLAASDVFVLPSLWEGLPMAVLEAMASGLPVIATRVSGNAQVVVDGHTGLLVKPADPTAIGTAIRELLTHPERARPMGLAGRRRVERYYSGYTQAARHAVLFRKDRG